jgi:hypothetical protein
MADLSATFRKPFSEALAAIDLRLADQRAVSTSRDPAYSGHERSFMVAGAIKADLIDDLGQAIRKARTDGTGYDVFKKDFRAIVERNGWHGWTGEGTAKGEEWRMRTIYQTNMRTSYMAGRLAQLRKSGFKFWVYRHSGAAHPRLNHLAFDGIALPPDHPFWVTHYPPNGWGCGCIVEGAMNAAGIRSAYRRTHRNRKRLGPVAGCGCDRRHRPHRESKTRKAETRCRRRLRRRNAATRGRGLAACGSAIGR